MLSDVAKTFQQVFIGAISVYPACFKVFKYFMRFLRLDVKNVMNIINKYSKIVVNFGKWDSSAKATTFTVHRMVS